MTLPDLSTQVLDADDAHLRFGDVMGMGMGRMR